MTLFTSDMRKTPDLHWKTIFLYLAATMFCIVFGAIYESFSHGVYSFFMIYAFLFPLAGGMIPLFLMQRCCLPKPSFAAGALYHAGIATATVGSIVSGVLEIYGTTNSLTIIYWLAGILLSGGGIILYLVQAAIQLNRSVQE